MDKRQKELFKWAVEHSDQSQQVPNQQPVQQPRSELNSEIIDKILGPDDATLMRYALQSITSSETSLEDKEIAFENFEMV